LTARKYVKMEDDEYYGHRDGVDQMVVSSLGNNMAYNPFQKRKVTVKNQSYAFHTCSGNIRNINGSDISVAQLDRLWVNKEQFALYIYLNEAEFLKKSDLEIDLKMWVKDSIKILNAPKLDEVEKMKHLPKKDFKIDFDNNSHAVLKNCKFVKLLSNIRKPVSKLCSTCGYQIETDKPITQWTCPKCGNMHLGEPIITSFAMIVERIIFTKN